MTRYYMRLKSTGQWGIYYWSIGQHVYLDKVFNTESEAMSYLNEINFKGGF